MSSLLRNPVARRLLRPAATLIDQRVQRPVSRLRKDMDKAALAGGEAMRKDLAALRAEVAELRTRLYPAELLFERPGAGRNRMPTREEIEQLSQEVAKVSGQHVGFARRNVKGAFRTVIALEALGVGRLAGTTSNVCGKLATVPLLDPPNGEVLEIGTLYGLFSAAFLPMLHRAGVEARLTIVDPLAGDQLQPGATMGSEPTGTPVRMDVLRANLALGGAAGAAARVQQGFSTDPEVREAVSDRAYGVIIVDGDHSAAGVAADLEWAETIAAPGGIVVLDDYGDKNWLGVQEATDRHLAGDTRFEMLGRAATSAFLRARL
ncbi:class I SAM-dependent methyltransferase [Streptomyces sp. NBC_01190]|uniref:class I SAM-dependent methyltransferase n=1 Tax=Streptomyces sp. NBC_01190 TaxID=2903767 RepID=UPI00386994D7|nr:class I SAM-dependent methyltransferase [Streptomyces sp. NBC_01190]